MSTLLLTRTRKLFLSFGGLASSLRDGQLTQDDLDHGLYCFTRPPEYIRNPRPGSHLSELDWVFGTDQIAAVLVHSTIVQTIERASRDNRVAFCPYRESDSWEQLRQLLRANDIAAPESGHWSGEFTTSRIRKAVGAATDAVTVEW